MRACPRLEPHLKLVNRRLYASSISRLLNRLVRPPPRPIEWLFGEPGAAV
jgi:hypothetical protein